MSAWKILTNLVDLADFFLRAPSITRTICAKPTIMIIAINNRMYQFANRSESVGSVELLGDGVVLVNGLSVGEGEGLSPGARVGVGDEVGIPGPGVGVGDEVGFCKLLIAYSAASMIMPLVLS